MQTSNQQNLAIRILMISLFVYAWTSVNIYLPALPSLVHAFHTDPRNLNLSITLFLGGYALSQLVWGPMSEKHGRRKTMIFGLVITMAGVLITMFSVDVAIFDIGRLVEALGLGSASVIGRAILVDTLDTPLLLKTMTYATIAVNTMPAIAPIIGGNLSYFFGWRSIFLFLLIYSMILLYFFVAKLSETHKHIRHDIQVKEMLSQYREVIANKRYVGYVLIYLLGTGAMIGYYTLAPFLFIKYLHISAHVYGYLGLATVAAYLLGAFVCWKLAPKLGIEKMILIGTSFLLLAALLIIGLSFYYPLSILSVLIPMSVYTFSAGILSPNVNTGAMKESAHIAGAGAAILGFGVYAGSAVFSSIATSLSLKSLEPLAIYVSSVAALVFIIFWGMVYQKKGSK